MTRIEIMLRDTMGLDAASVGSALIERCIRSRMQIGQIERTDDYLTLLKESPEEWNALVEAVVVNETWFFRDQKPFQALAQLVIGDWFSANPAGLLRILSIPCSTGEEPYSIAMTLLDAGLPPNRFQIDAIDISARALAAAQRAIYGRNSFRNQDLRFRQKYFEQTDAGYLLNAPVRQRVRFQAENLLDPGCLTGAAVYDFIFCRNLLIYFDAPTQKQAVLKFLRLLKDPGYLFVGPAEMPPVLEHGFEASDGYPTFACRKRDARKSRVERTGSIAKSRESQAFGWPPRPAQRILVNNPHQPSVTGAKTPAMPVVTTGTTPARSQAATPPPESPNLDEAQRLADAGKLGEAAVLCEAFLRANGVSARAYYLLGLVRDAGGQSEPARELYRKALYLDPNHYESLVQLALLSAKIGEHAQAGMLRQRAGRARQPATPT